jgi:hypothetical protein
MLTAAAAGCDRLAVRQGASPTDHPGSTQELLPYPHHAQGLVAAVSEEVLSALRLLGSGAVAEVPRWIPGVLPPLRLLTLTERYFTRDSRVKGSCREVRASPSRFRRGAGRRVLSKTLLMGVIIVTFLSPPLLAQQRSVIKAADVVVIYDEPLRRAAEVVAEGYGSLKLELETILGWKVDFVPVVVLVQERSDFQRITGSSLVVAVAAPDKNLIIIDYSRMNTHPFSLGTTLKHELCHLVLHHVIPGGKLPAWLDEGLAQWVSDGLAEILGDGRGSVLQDAVLANNQIALSKLTKGFPPDRASLFLAYEESKSLVDYIVTEFGRTPLLSMLQYLREGDGVDTAAQRGLGVSMAELESRWHEHLRMKSSWFPIATSNLGEILLFLAAFLTIAAFLRLITNKRRYRDEDLPGQ